MQQKNPLDKIVNNHYERLFASVLKKHTAGSIYTWIPKNTKLAMQPFNYEGHEYQERILMDTSQELNCQKCSQVGISEVSARKGLALVNVISPYTVCYTMPTAKFGGTFMRTRIDPIILGSETMMANIHTANDNSELKQFGESFFYMKGAASSNAPISIPVDHLIHDEWDFSDQEVLGQYTSRLTHSRWKKVDRFSTPTLPNFGIHRQMLESRRHLLMCKCHHCNHQFVPSYYDHVRIPEFTGDLREINKTKMHKVRWMDAVLLCPGCGKEPSLLPAQREWVCENPDDNFVAAGYAVSPFDAPKIIKPSDLVKASTSYDRIQDFVNFNLGLPAEDNDATLTDADIRPLFALTEANSAVQYVMGVDVGNIYHFVIGAVDAWGEMFVVHTEQVPLRQARIRYDELRRQYRIICSVIDSQPHAETVMALQATDNNLYASVYMRSKSILTHTVVEREKVDEEGKDFVRQVNVNRSRALDGYMEYIRSGHLAIRDSEEKDTIIQHHTSMKRVKVYDNESTEMGYSWQKSDGEDHYHHAFLYCWIAGKIKGVGKSLVQLPIFGIYSFRNKTL